MLGIHNKKGKLLFLGLDCAGKTTLLHRLKNGRMVAALPTGQPSSEELVLGRVSFTTFDLGGHKEVRRIWRDYFPAVDGIVFVLDANNRRRFYEAKVELNALLTEEQISDVPIVIIANKIDEPYAASEDEVRCFFGLKDLTSGKMVMSRKEIPGRPLELFMCSVLQQQGYGEAIRWLAQFI